MPASIRQLAYVSTRKERPAPQSKLNDQGRLYLGQANQLVGEVALYKDCLNYGKSQRQSILGFD